MKDTNKTHKDYLKMKSVMIKAFPNLFSKPKPFAPIPDHVSFFMIALRKKGITKAGETVITGRMVHNFFRCWMSRREYAKAITTEEFYINQCGESVLVISNWDKAVAFSRYQTICRKQKIKE